MYDQITQKPGKPGNYPRVYFQYRDLAMKHFSGLSKMVGDKEC